MLDGAVMYLWFLSLWGVLTRRGLEELKGRVAALEGEKISTETVEETVDKSLLTFRGGANGPRRVARIG